MSEIGFGIIGCGFGGDLHAETITNIKHSKLLGVFDVDEEKAEELGRKYHTKAYIDLEKLLSQGDIQIVSICTPSGLHASIGIKAAEAGKHLVIEKPLDLTVEKCDAVIAAARQNEVKLAVIFQNRFKEAVHVLRSALEEGRFGRLLLGNALVKWYRNPEYYKKKRKDDIEGVLINQSIHTIDLLQWMMGPVKNVQSKVTTLVHDIEAEDTALAILEFENGALGLIEGTTSIYPGFDERLEIHGENGSVCVEGSKIVTWEFRQKKEEDEEMRRVGHGEKSGGAREPAEIPREYHKKQIEDMVDAVFSNRKPLVDGEEGKKSVEIITRILDVSG